MIRHKRILFVPLLLIIAILTVLLLRNGKTDKSVSLETVPVSTGSVARSISATGTVEPIDKVVVGTQVSGVVEKIHADYNSTVHKGQLIAELDKTPLQATLDLNNVALKSAQIEAAFQKQKFERVSKLFEKGMVSQQEIDQAQYDYDRANISVERALSEVKKAKLNLSYATIYSPIDGTVLSRSVDEGQTVAASLNAPTLFTIAHNLLAMEVYAAVDEADIGQVKKDQRVIFTVDAFPEDTFDGSVSQVRLEPTVTSNVVTYTVTILAGNPDLKLMPGMTATITVYINEVNNVLTVPMKALNFRPDENLLAKLNPQSAKDDKNNQKREKSGSAVSDSAHKKSHADSQGSDPARSVRPGKKKFDRAAQKDRATVWIKKGVSISPVRIKTGLSDGINIQVIEGLKEGEEIVLSVRNESVAAKKQTSGNVNPFMPQRPGRNRRMR